jgi:uncharacterized protein
VAKASTGLRVSPTLTLPLDAVTQSFALLAVRGAGKCLDGDSEVYDPASGLLHPIREVVSGETGTAVATLHQRAVITAAPIHDRIFSGIQECVEVMLASGRRLVATPTHPVMSTDGWVPVASLQVGTSVAVPHRLPHPSQPAALDPAAVDLLAILLAEGACASSTITFTTADPEIERIAEHATRALGMRLNKVPGTLTFSFAGVTSPPVPAGECHCGCGQRTNLARQSDKRRGDVAGSPYRFVGRHRPRSAIRQFVRDFGIGYPAHQKRIPPAVFRLPAEQLARFLSVLWMCDGYVERNGPGVTLASEVMVRQLQHLLLRFGVQSRVAAKPTKRRLAWRLSVYAGSVPAFASAIPLWGQKAERLHAAVGRTRNPNVGRPAHTRAFRAWVAERSVGTRAARRQRAAAVARAVGSAHPAQFSPSALWRSTGTISRTLLQAWADATGVASEVPELLSADLFWDRVVSVEPAGVRDTFDLEVAGSHCFVAGDILVHNSNGAAVLAEEMYAAGLPWVVVDPKGDYWGLRSSRDGSGPGLPIPLFGGLRGDLPLEPEAGALMAELVVEENLTCVLDVSEFASKAAQMRFLTDFAERLFRLHGKHPQPRHLILEEADEYLPQRALREQLRCLGAWTRIVKQGRHRGLGITLVSQRSAVVAKDALTQTETLIAMRTTSPQDRKAILGWVDYHAVARELVDSLPGLEDGEAWVCSPHWLKTHQLAPVQRVRFRQRTTFDSGATPAFGPGQRRRPATIADIDLGALRDRMAAVVEKAARDDPAVLRGRIVELERALAAARRSGSRRQAPLPERVVETVTVEVPVLDEHLIGAVEQLAKTAQDAGASLTALIEAASREQAVLQEAADGARQALEAARQRLPGGSPPPRRTPQPAPAAGAAAAPPAAGTEGVAGDGAGNGGGALPRAQRAILTVLAQFPAGRSKRQLALQAGYAAKGGGFNNALSALRTAGLVVVERGEPIRATEAGIAALGGAFQPLPTGPALLAYWLGELGPNSAGAKILTVLVDAWPAVMDKETVAERTGYVASGGGFNNALSRLRTLQLIDGSRELRADDTLARQAQDAGTETGTGTA